MLIKHYLFPLIKRQKALFFAMALMSALSFSMFVGLSYANNNYQISLDNYFKDYNYPSAVITTDLTTENTFADLKNVVGLQDYDVRFSSLFNINVNGEYINIVLSTYKQDDFTKFAYMSDYVQSDNIEVYIDQQFAEVHNIKEGDTIQIGKKGKFCTCTVSQIVLKPENFCVYALGDVPTDNIGFGAAFIKHEDLGRFLSSIGIDNFDLDSNQVLLKIYPFYDKQTILDNCCKEITKNNNTNHTDESEIEKEKINIDELLEKYGIDPNEVTIDISKYVSNEETIEEFDGITILSSVIDEDTPPIGLREEMTVQFGALSNLVPLAFLLIMSIVFVLFLIQIITKHAREIGVLLSLGYEKKSIYFLFVAFTFIINITSIVIGILLSLIIRKQAYILYQSSVHIPAWETEFFLNDILFASLIVIVTGQIACLISAISFKNSSPMDALESNYQNYIVLGKKYERFLYKIPVAIRLALNSILQNFKNFIVVIFGFVASFVLVFSSLSMNASMKEYVDYTYDVQKNYDVQVVSLLGNFDETIEELNNCEYVTQLQTYNSISVDISHEGNTKECKIIDFPQKSNMIQFNDVITGERLITPNKGIILDKLTAKALDVKVGDEVRFCNKRFKVNAIANMYSRQFCIINPEEMKHLEVEKTKEVVANITNKEKFEEFCAFSDNELFPVFTSNFKQMEKEFKKAISSSVDIAIVISVALGFVVVCTVSLMTLEKQKRIVSILRSQGMSLFAISNYWGIQMIIQLVVAFIIGKPISSFAAQQFIQTLSSEYSYYPFVNNNSIYFNAFSFIVAFSIVTHIVIMFYVSKINIAQNVQSRE